MKKISYPGIKDKIVAFINSRVSESGAKVLFIGLSGV